MSAKMADKAASAKKVPAPAPKRGVAGTVVTAVLLVVVSIVAVSLEGPGGSMGPHRARPFSLTPVALAGPPPEVRGESDACDFKFTRVGPAPRRPSSAARVPAPLPLGSWNARLGEPAAPGPRSKWATSSFADHARAG